MLPPNFLRSSQEKGKYFRANLDGLLVTLGPVPLSSADSEFLGSGHFKLFPPTS